jgi:dimethylamine monooxygenase subunit A
MAFDFDAAVSAPFRMQPGLRRLPPDASPLTPLQPGSRHQREKLAVLSAFANEALLDTPGFDPLPALHALCQHAAAAHPQHWVWDGDSAHAPTLGCAVASRSGAVQQAAAGAFGLGDEIARCLAGLAPSWRLAGLLALAFAEDLAIVDGRSGTIPWLAVALPSHWAPQDKVGQGFAAVHAPVAEGERVRAAADALVASVTQGGPWERFVWTITPHPRLHAHPARVPPQRWTAHDPDGDGRRGPPFDPARTWFRSERQAFLPLPALQQAVFGIAVEVQPLAEVIDSPARAARLHAALASMGPAVLAYRDLQTVHAPLLAWLAQRAGEGADNGVGAPPDAGGNGLQASRPATGR